MKNIIVLFALIFSMPIFAQQVVGRVISEEEIGIGGVMLINLKTNEKVYTHTDGKFRITAQKGEEIRAIKKGYERISYIVKDEGVELTLKMPLAEVQIEEVLITKIKLTGDIAKDTKALDKETQKEKLRKALGMEEIEKKVRTLSSLGMNFDPNNLFGKEKRHKKSVAKYEAQENNADWIRLRIEDEYFVEKGIPAERIPEFLTFALSERTELSAIIRAKNLTKVRAILEEVLPIYIKRLNVQELK